MEKAERCPTCKRLKRRSNNANARFWLLLHLIAENVKPEGKAYTAEQFHIYFKQKFLGMNEVALPNGKTIMFPKSTAELDTAEFAEHMAKVEQWAIERNIFMDELEPT